MVLRFDEDRLDRYDHELAGVFDADDVLVNAKIARAGLGVAVLHEPDRRFHADVLEAQEEAERRRARPLLPDPGLHALRSRPQATARPS